MKTPVLHVAAVGICVSLLGACGNDSPEAAAKMAIEAAARAEGQDVSVDIGANGGSMSIKSADGTVTYSADGNSMQMTSAHGTVTVGGAARVPDGFPEDVAIHPDFKLNSATSAGDEGAYSLSGTVDAPLDAVKAYYEQEAQARGWQEATAMTQPQLLMLVFEKDGRNLQVMASADDDGGVTLSLTTAGR
jgi:hypothetical protein